ncbi:hypothetical protein BaRGS_00005575 [Batillaria attramentaria]|uniref:Synaptotagmin-like protein 5 n=1 Tax=Batillaria attramentaria TaxID=370345 RepID=A0ABD0LVX2_9CAEN
MDLELLDLEGLTTEERTIILNVMRRDEELRQRQDNRISQLKSELHNIRMNSVLRNGDDLTKMCARCHTPFGMLTNTGEICPACRFRVCKNCRERLLSQGWLCVLCFKENQLKWLTGDWLPKDKKQNSQVNATDLVRASLRVKHSNGNLGGLEDRASHNGNRAVGRVDYPQDSDKKGLSTLFESIKSGLGAGSPEDEQQLAGGAVGGTAPVAGGGVVHRVSCRRRRDSNSSSNSDSDEEVGRSPSRREHVSSLETNGTGRKGYVPRYAQSQTESAPNSIENISGGGSDSRLNSLSLSSDASVSTVKEGQIVKVKDLQGGEGQQRGDRDGRGVTPQAHPRNGRRMLPQVGVKPPRMLDTVDGQKDEDQPSSGCSYTSSEWGDVTPTDHPEGISAQSSVDRKEEAGSGLAQSSGYVSASRRNGDEPEPEPAPRKKQQRRSGTVLPPEHAQQSSQPADAQEVKHEQPKTAALDQLAPAHQGPSGDRHSHPVGSAKGGTQTHVRRQSSGVSDSMSLSSARTASPATKMRLLDMASNRAMERDGDSVKSWSAGSDDTLSLGMSCSGMRGSPEVPASLTQKVHYGKKSKGGKTEPFLPEGSQLGAVTENAPATSLENGPLFSESVVDEDAEKARRVAVWLEKGCVDGSAGAETATTEQSELDGPSNPGDDREDEEEFDGAATDSAYSTAGSANTSLHARSGHGLEIEDGTDSKRTTPGTMSPVPLDNSFDSVPDRAEEDATSHVGLDDQVKEAGRTEGDRHGPSQNGDYSAAKKLAKADGQSLHAESLEDQDQCNDYHRHMDTSVDFQDNTHGEAAAESTVPVWDTAQREGEEVGSPGVRGQVSKDKTAPSEKPVEDIGALVARMRTPDTDLSYTMQRYFSVDDAASDTLSIISEVTEPGDNTDAGDDDDRTLNDDDDSDGSEGTLHDDLDEHWSDDCMELSDIGTVDAEGLSDFASTVEGFPVRRDAASTPVDTTADVVDEPRTDVPQDQSQSQEHQQAADTVPLNYSQHQHTNQQPDLQHMDDKKQLNGDCDTEKSLEERGSQTDAPHVVEGQQQYLEDLLSQQNQQDDPLLSSKAMMEDFTQTEEVPQQAESSQHSSESQMEDFTQTDELLVDRDQQTSPHLVRSLLPGKRVFFTEASHSKEGYLPQADNSKKEDLHLQPLSSDGFEEGENHDNDLSGGADDSLNNLSGKEGESTGSDEEDSQYSSRDSSSLNEAIFLDSDDLDAGAGKDVPIEQVTRDLQHGSDVAVQQEDVNRQDVERDAGVSLSYSESNGQCQLAPAGAGLEENAVSSDQLSALAPQDTADRQTSICAMDKDENSSAHQEVFKMHGASDSSEVENSVHENTTEVGIVSTDTKRQDGVSSASAHHVSDSAACENVCMSVSTASDSPAVGGTCHESKFAASASCSASPVEINQGAINTADSCEKGRSLKGNTQETNIVQSPKQDVREVLRSTIVHPAFRRALAGRAVTFSKVTKDGMSTCSRTNQDGSLSRDGSAGQTASPGHVLPAGGAKKHTLLELVLSGMGNSYESAPGTPCSSEQSSLDGGSLMSSDPEAADNFQIPHITRSRLSDGDHASGSDLSAQGSPDKRGSSQHLSVPSHTGSLDERSSVDEDENIDELFAKHRMRSSLGVSRSSLGDSRESLASVYSDAGEINYGRIPVTGNIVFGLDYDHKRSALVISIKCCEDLAPVDTKHNRSDPYVKVYLLPDKTRSGKRKSKIKKHTLNPVYNETLTYNISSGELQNRTLWVTVWHSDRFGRNDFLGEVLIPMDTYRFDDPSPNRYALQSRMPEMVNEEAMQYKGELIVSVRYVTPDQASGDKKSKSKSKKTKTAAERKGEIHVMIKSAKNLTAVRSSGASDPFVKGYLLPDRTRTGKQKTPVVKNSVNPMWNHIFTFDGIDQEELPERCLELTVWDHEKLGTNEFLGGARLNLGHGAVDGHQVEWMDARGEEAIAWQNMIDSPNTWVDARLPLRASMGKPSKK